jgi:hypothetical protein
MFDTSGVNHILHPDQFPTTPSQQHQPGERVHPGPGSILIPERQNVPRPLGTSRYGTDPAHPEHKLDKLLGKKDLAADVAARFSGENPSTGEILGGTKELIDSAEGPNNNA